MSTSAEQDTIVVLVVGPPALKLLVAVVVMLLVAAAGQPSAVPADVITLAVVPPVAAGCQLPTSTISPYLFFCYFCLPDVVRIFVNYVVCFFSLSH